MKKIALAILASLLAGCVTSLQHSAPVQAVNIPPTPEVKPQPQTVVVEPAQFSADGLGFNEESLTGKSVEVPNHVKEVIKLSPSVAEPEVKPVSKPTYQYSDLNKSAYAIQLVASGSKDQLSSYAKQLPKGEALWISKTDRNGQPWYALLYGQYDSRDAAHEAIVTLPLTVQQNGAFIKNLQSLKESENTQVSSFN
ncbi:TPA: SPOR domain-containing protein [Photobacterium damselae]